MEEKDLYILKLCKFLKKNNTTMSFTELGEHVNRNFENCKFSETKGRGMASSLSNLYRKRIENITEEQKILLEADIEYLRLCILQIKSEDGSDPRENYKK